MTDKERQEYRERCRVQCLHWAMGNVYHNRVDNECTPDFSCCYPEMLMPEDERWQYYHKEYGRKQ